MHRSLAFSSLRLLGHHCRRVGQVAITKYPPQNIVGRALFVTETAFKMNSPTSNKQDDKQIKSSTLDDEDDCCEDVEISEEDTETITEYKSTYQDITSKFTTEDTLNIETLQKGIPDTFYIISHTSIPSQGFPLSDIEKAFTPEEIERLQLKPDNVTVPVALILLFPDQFTSQTRARKESRRRKILLHRGPLDTDGNFHREKLKIGKVGDRVVPGDVLAVQARMEHNYSESANHHKEPPFDLPVVYEDDHFAIVNKPEGIVTFGPKGGGYGRMTIKACLPWFITPPKPGTVNVLRRPSPVHRIDRGTSGLLVIAKTRPAMVELSRMFKERKAKKTYTAIVNGNIEEPNDTSITSEEAEKLGVCIDGYESSNDTDLKKRPWQLISNQLEDQTAVTIWRLVKQYNGIENARNNTLSLVELKPKTGRYHQLRRHMAWSSQCPLLGDKTYDGGGNARLLRDNGFYLCSNKIVIEHPFYNVGAGRTLWKKIKDTEMKRCNDHKNNIRIAEESDGKVLVYAEIDLPPKFNDLFPPVK
jgi:23S rRNA-/tRNA-specific pseudouridylate synthase